MPLFWFMSFVHGIKRIRDKTFCFDIWLGPNLCTRKVTWDSYFRIATFVTWEMSNDRFTIPEPILPIANKRQLTILELLKKKKQIKVLLWAQTANKQRCSYELKKINKQGCSYKLKRISISVVSIWGSCLKLLWVACASCLLRFYLYLFLWGFCLGVTLVSISISTSSIVLACSIPLEYLHMFVDVSTCSIPSRYVHEFCLFWPTRESWVNDPLGMIKGNSLGSMIFSKLWWPSGEPSCWGKTTCWEIWWWFWPTGSPWKCVIHWGRFSFFLHGLLGNLYWFYPQGSFINFMSIIIFTTYEGVAIVPWTHGGFPSWYCTLLGIFLKIWTLEEFLLVTYGSLKDALDAFNLLWILVWSLCLSPNWGYFVHFVMFLNFFSCTSYLLGIYWRFWGLFCHFWVYSWIFLCSPSLFGLHGDIWNFFFLLNYT